jgi:coenzyme F420-reducing hydrogenase delta subunit
MCSGRVDPVFIFQAFLCGFDGVLVLGCHPGDCHYLVGNYHAEKKINRVKKLLEIIGISSGRLYLDWVSAAEGARFAQIVDSFTERIRQQGALNKDPSLLQKLQAAKLTLEKERIRWLLGNELDLIDKGNVYGERIPFDELDAAISEALEDEFFKSWLGLISEENPVSVMEMATVTHLSLQSISNYLTDLEEVGEISLHGFEGRTAKYVKSK